MMTFSMRASITEKSDKLRAAIVLLVSEMSGADMASFTSLTLELASTMRLRTPAMSKVKGGGCGERGIIPGQIEGGLFPIADTHSFGGGIRAGAGREITGTVEPVGVNGRGDTIATGNGWNERPDNGWFHIG
jgi:hypothetical protein